MPAEDSLIVTTGWADGSIFDLKIAELLTKYGIKGTFYIPKPLFAHPLQRHDIVAIDEHFEVGSHTLNHVDLTKVPLSEAKKEIKGSKEYLDDLLGHSVSVFTYPNGKYNKNIKKLVKDSGFVAARAAKPSDFRPPSDPYEWPVTLLATNRAPLMALKFWFKNPIAIKGLLDWETRARLLFDKALKVGGIYHIYGHSLDLELYLEWDKLERVLDYISHREGVSYMTNGEAFQHRRGREGNRGKGVVGERI